MPYEVERKFLVTHDGWRSTATGRRHLRDGLIGPYQSSKVRVRRDGERAWLTVKGPREGLGRSEFEYKIPAGDTRAMQTSCCAASARARRSKRSATVCLLPG